MEATKKDITTLIDDIYGLLDRGVSFTPDPSYLKAYSKAMEGHMEKALASNTRVRERGKLWFSDLGERCARKTWYKWNAEPGEGEELRGNTLFKFLYGNTLEEQVLYLAKEAGHTVEREQERIEYKHEDSGWTISGRIDAYIDGVLVDVKSCSSYAFKKYREEGVTEDTDSFGYRYQLSGYAVLPSHNEATLLGTRDVYGIKGEHATIQRGGPAFLFVDKQNGSLALSPIEPISRKDILDDIANVAKTVGGHEMGARKAYTSVPEGKSGNLKLGIECSYCPYKFRCWPGLQGYAYSYGPVYLTHVVREPNVPRIEREETK